MEQFKSEIITLFGKIWFWAVGIIVGLIGKICYEVMVGKKLSFIQVLATGGVAVSVGCMAAFLCVSKGMEPMYGTFVCACATWLGDKFAIIFMSMNKNDFFNYIEKLKGK